MKISETGDRRQATGDRQCSVARSVVAGRLLPVSCLLLHFLSNGCGPGSYGDFREQLVDAACKWGTRCGYVGQADRAACPVDELLVIFSDAPPNRGQLGAIDVSASVEAGRMRYDSVHAQECLDAIADAPCDSAHAARARALKCNAVIGAHVETDRPCWSDLECTGGICVHTPDCAGTCGNYASPGAPCVDAADAPLTMRCDPTVGYCGAVLAGMPTTCQPKKGEGSDCIDSRECLFGWTCRKNVCVEPIEVADAQPCGGVDPCADGLYCDPSTLTCARQHKRAEPCNDRFGCVDGLACLGVVPVDPMGVPTPVTTSGICGDWLDLGRPCKAIGGDPEPSITGCPTLSQACDNGVCTSTMNTAALGESCASTPCRDGLACNLQKKCDYSRAIFGDCRRDRAPLCEPGLVCSGADADLGTSGETCLPPNVADCFAPVGD